MRPVLRYVGGKQRLGPLLSSIWREQGCTRWIEPFFGAGGAFFCARPHHALLADASWPLMVFYGALAVDARGVLDYLRPLVRETDKAPEACYYACRDALNAEQMSETLDPLRFAALFLYVNACGFQGLWRVNREGLCNVPFGGRSRPFGRSYELFERRVLSIAGVLQRGGVRVLHGDFRELFGTFRFRPGDFLYCDPPYYKSFDSYTREGFGNNDRIEMASLCLQARKAGAVVIVSDNDMAGMEIFYPELDWERVPVGRHIQCLVPEKATRTPEAIYVARER